jgi:hypothetical protein
LAVLSEGVFRDGIWSQIRPLPAWADNWTFDCFVAYAWAGAEGSRYIIPVNYADNQGQCHLPLPFPELRGKQVRLTDVMGIEVYDRDALGLVDPGLSIDHSPWHFNVFALRDRQMAPARADCPTGHGAGFPSSAAPCWGVAAAAFALIERALTAGVLADTRDHPRSASASRGPRRARLRGEPSRRIHAPDRQGQTGSIRRQEG